MTARDAIPLVTVEAEIKARSGILRRELGLGDLILAQVLIVMVPEFFGTAVKAGRSHVVLWCLAIVLFFIPQAFVVSHLNRLMPLEGGLYEWARLAFSDRIGFLVAWNMWLNVTVQVSQIALVTTTYVSYAFGPRAEGIASNPRILLAASVGLIVVMMSVAGLGLKVGKWISNAGSVFTVLTIGALIALPYFHVWRGRLADYHPLAVVKPPLTLFSLSVFSKMTFGALSGFEYVAIFAGESRNPRRNLARSILFTAPIIALLYILGTSSILAFVSPDAIDVIGPIPQALSRGFAIFGPARPLIPLVILLLLMNYVCSYTLYFSANTRLPLVAGWDHLLPQWFTQLHPKYRTPINSILFMGAIALAASVAVLIGSGNQEAFALLQVWTWTFYGLAYLAMFAIPLFARKEKGIRPGAWLRLAAVSGWLVTLLFVLLSVLPVIEVQNKFTYSLKTSLVVIGANIIGWGVYRAGRRDAAQMATGTSATGSS
ncbi:MAG TPA: APC family permease [Candidatus Sulfotelmatobacter sp.]